MRFHYCVAFLKLKQILEKIPENQIGKPDPTRTQIQLLQDKQHKLQRLTPKHI